METFTNSSRDEVRGRHRNLVIAKMALDPEQPFRGWGMTIPIVSFSMSADYPVGRRLVWGNIRDLLQRGFAVEILP